MSVPGADTDAVRRAALRLVCLPDMTPARLWALLRTFGGHESALAAVAEGRGREADGADETRTSISPWLARQWESACGSGALDELLEGRSPHVWLSAGADFPIDVPASLSPQPPAVLLGEGDDPDVLRRRRVAVVGTRSASVHGRADAHAIGVSLAEAGVTVVSGLALGIDGAAHEGVLEGGGAPVGVVATGLDIEYPRRHRDLYRRVRESGVLVSEVGYGVGPTRERFPIRNRIIAGLADVVVVVEATARGGARITANHALQYGRSVLAVPGSRRNPAAEGCNELLRDGAQPLLVPGDIVDALGLCEGATQLRWTTAPEPMSAKARQLLLALGGEPATNDDLRCRLAWSPNALAVALAEVEARGQVRRVHGRWWPA